MFIYCCAHVPTTSYKLYFFQSTHLLIKLILIFFIEQSNVFMHRKSHSSTRISDVAANTLCQSIPVKTRQHPARSKLTRGSLAAPSSLVELSDPVFMRTRKIYSPPPSVQNEAAANTSLLAKKSESYPIINRMCDINRTQSSSSALLFHYLPKMMIIWSLNAKFFIIC